MNAARDLLEFGQHSTRVFHELHSLDDELAWLDVQGPVCPGLLRARRPKPATNSTSSSPSACRYPTAFHAARLAPDRTVLVPTMETRGGDGAVAPATGAPRRARDHVQLARGTAAAAGAVRQSNTCPVSSSGIGSEIPPDPQPARARARFGLTQSVHLYVGRIDANKGCDELFALFLSYLRVSYLKLQDRELDLVLIGTPVLPISAASAHPSSRVRVGRRQVRRAGRGRSCS